MKLVIENFRKIEHAEINLEIAKINLFAGHGHQGKTSIIKALTAAATRNPLPFYRADGKKLLDKKEALLIVNDGAREASVNFEGVEITWPECAIKTQGAAIAEINEFAAGLIHYTELDDKARSIVLGQLLGTEPTKESLKKELQNLKLPAQAIDKILNSIDAIGWDSTFDETQKKNTQLKGQWREAAGETWGSAKSNTWQPADFSPEMEGMSRETLLDELTQNRESLEAHLGMQGATEQEIQTLEKNAAPLQNARAELPILESKLQTYESEILAADILLKEFPAKGERKKYGCPHCKKHIEIKRAGGDVVLEVFADLEGDTLEYYTAKHNEAKTAINNATTKRDEIGQKLRALRVTLANATEAAEKLAEIDKDAGGNNAQQIAKTIDACRNSVAQSEKRLAALDSKTRADAINQNISMNIKIQDILKPDGLRKIALENALKRFNDYIAKMCLGRYEILIKDDLSLRMNGRIFALLSGSEQFLARSFMQMAIGTMNRAQMLIFDGADILDRTDRTNFIAALAACNSTCVVSMTMLNKTDTPVLSQFGIGKTFWIEDGKCEELK